MAHTGGQRSPLLDASVVTSDRQSIGLLCGAAEQRGLLLRRAAGGDALEGVPHYRIAAHAFVDREIALEHRALWAEGIDAGLDIGAPCLLEVFRGGRHVILEKREAGQLHAEPAELHISVGMARDLADAVAPLSESLLALAGIGANC